MQLFQAKLKMSKEWLIPKQETKIKAANIFLNLMPNKILKVTYNDLQTDREKTLKIIGDFLELTLSQEDKFTSELKKIKNKSHRQIVKDYEEVNWALSGTKFFTLLNP